MIEDIVDRLRSRAWYPHDSDGAKLDSEAADEIERLRRLIYSGPAGNSCEPDRVPTDVSLPDGIDPNVWMNADPRDLTPIGLAYRRKAFDMALETMRQKHLAAGVPADEIPF